MTVQAERRTKRRSKLAWYILGPAVCLISLPAALYICALLLANSVLSFEVTEELVIASVFLCTTLGGIAGCAARGGKVMQTGLSVGAIFALIIVVICLAAPGEGAFNATSLRHVIAAVTGGAFGGALCIKRGNKNSRHKRRKK